MKSILTITAVLSLNLAQAQCSPFPECTNEVQMCNIISNMNLQGNWCFEGYGSIAQSVNWNNWDWIQFHSTTASINLQQNVNFGGGSKKVYNSGYAVNYWGNTSFSGADTMFVGAGCTVQITNPLSNNSNSSNYNTIVLGPGATLYIGVNMVQYEAGDTIKTNPSNNSNNIYVVGCAGSPLAIDKTKFYIHGNLLYWEVESTNLKVQYSSDSKSWNTIHYSSFTNGNLAIHESGFYRLQYDDKFSETIPYNMKSLRDDRIYYYMGNFYKQQPEIPYYGTKSK